MTKAELASGSGGPPNAGRAPPAIQRRVAIRPPHGEARADFLTGWRRTDENVVITAGSLTFGMGDKLSKTAKGNKTIGVGGFTVTPTGMNHYAYAGEKGADFVLFGQGPVEFKYVNPADDPRNAKPATN